LIYLSFKQMNLFGRKKKQEPSSFDPSPTMIRIRSTMDTLEKREAFLQKKIELTQAEAKKKLQAKDKKGAMLCLKRKKMYEGEITKIQGARITMEQQVLSLENHSITMETVRTMQQGAQTMKTMRGKMGADDVADLMDDIREEMDTAEELSNELSRPAQELFDDAELLEELNELELLLIYFSPAAMHSYQDDEASWSSRSALFRHGLRDQDVVCGLWSRQVGPFTCRQPTIPKRYRSTNAVMRKHLSRPRSST